MDRQEIYSRINEECDYQDTRWGKKFDDQNTPNDWITYMVRYLGKAVTMPFDRGAFRLAIIKVIAIGVAVLEREDYAPRHYDEAGEGGRL